jgi:hypothetical protein
MCFRLILILSNYINTSGWLQLKSDASKFQDMCINVLEDLDLPLLKIWLYKHPKFNTQNFIFTCELKYVIRDCALYRLYIYGRS